MWYFLIPLEVQDHTVPQWKALRCDEYEPRGLSFEHGKIAILSREMLKNEGFLKALYTYGSVYLSFKTFSF